MGLYRGYIGIMGYRVIGFGVSALGCMVWGLGLGFRVAGSGFRVLLGSIFDKGTLILKV